MLRILSFTKTGIELNEKLCKKLNNDSCAGYAPKRILGRNEELDPLPENIPEWIQEYWGVDDFLFIGAAGIAVRMIAPSVKDKYTDSAVLVMDENYSIIVRTYGRSHSSGRADCRHYGSHSGDHDSY